MRYQHNDQRFRDFAAALVPEIHADDHTLRSIAEKIGPGPSAVKEIGGWPLEKAARLKLGHTGSTDFSMFESLELLALGIHGKHCLWEALQVASRRDPRLREYAFEDLIGRAKQQYDKVNSERLNLAETILLPTS
jgi:hypothetical protein